MFDSLGWPELAALLFVALFVFGPERLPKAISDGVRMLRNVRQMARNASADLSKQLGTDIDVADLHPKRFVQKHLLTEEYDEILRKPLRELQGELDDLAGDIRSVGRGSSSRSAVEAGDSGESFGWSSEWETKPKGPAAAPTYDDAT